MWEIASLIVIVAFGSWMVWMSEKHNATKDDNDRS